MTEEGLERLVAANERCKEAVQREDITDYYDENEIFLQRNLPWLHKRIFRATNPASAKQVETLSQGPIAVSRAHV